MDIAMVGSMYYMDQAWNSLMIQITENEQTACATHLHNAEKRMETQSTNQRNKKTRNRES